MGSCESICKKHFKTQQSDSINLGSPYRIKIDQVIDNKELKIINVEQDLTKQQAFQHKSFTNSTQVQISYQNTLQSKPGNNNVDDQNIGTEEANIELDESFETQNRISSFPIQNTRYNKFFQCNMEEIESSRFEQKKKRKIKSNKDCQKQKLKEQIINYSKMKKKQHQVSCDDMDSIQEKNVIRSRGPSILVRGILKNPCRSADSVPSMISSSKSKSQSQSQDQKSVSFSKETNFNPRKRRHKMLSISQQEFMKKLRYILEKQQ